MLNELKFSTTLFQSYLSWIINLPTGTVATLILVLFFAFLIILEFYNPRERWLAKRLRQSYRENMQLFVFNSTIMSLLAIPSLFMLAQRYADKGLLSYLPDSVTTWVLTFLAMDLLLYFLHKASHNFDALWMLHRVHHNDPCLNVSTAFRIHFLEVLFISVMKALLVVILGINGSVLLVNEAIIIFFTMLHHTNTAFRGEHTLGRFVITPYLHRAHHSTVRDEHDSNYGTVLSIWDRLFGTLTEREPAKIGVNGNVPQGLFNLVKCGFGLTDRPITEPDNFDHMIAEAAYYKAEKRGFGPGNELCDWLEAKSEIIGLVYGKARVKNNLLSKWSRLMAFINAVLTDKNQRYRLFRS
ncbi:MAG: sterol desaturase family protein [Methylobacter sp.]|nr:sterol desaturase family protein [Methylobacter sp.]